MLNIKKASIFNIYRTSGHSSVVERLVANEKVVGSSPIARSKKEIFMTDLADKKCIPCEGGIPGFDISEIHKYLKMVDGWEVKKDEEDLEGTWLYEEKKKRGIIKDSSSDNDSPLSYGISTGGGDTLQGAAYYWFFTKLMIITAIIFIPFASLYRPKMYLHDKEEILGPFTIWTE